jgi:RNA polymerase sigma-70 factor (ECF subfamily)
MDLTSEVEEIAPRLLRYCLGETGDRGLAEEAAQEALAALVERWRRQGPPESPAAFVFAIARRRAWRLKLRRRLFEPLHALFDGHSPLPGPEAEAAGRTELDRTLKALERLPGRDREALLLVAAGELALEEGARLLGISKSALKMRLHRARQRLQSLLKERT